MAQISGHASLALVWLLALAGCASSTGVPSGNPVQAPAHTRTGVPGITRAPDQATALWQVFERYRGTPYRYGGTSAQGFDCSGFINAAYREGLGQQLPRTTAHMLRTGQSVDPEQIRPGDLIFFRIRGKEQHAGIYMGDDQFIHASTSAGVTLSALTNNYWKKRFSQARRYIRTPAPANYEAASAD